MRSGEVIVLLPARQLLADIVEREAHVDIQTLILETSVDTFDEAILYRFSWSNEVGSMPRHRNIRSNHVFADS